MLDRFLGGYVTASPTLPTQSSAQGVWELEQQASAQVQNAWPLPPNVIQRSLRFNAADVAYLSRTPSVTSDRKTYTHSFWIKRGILGALKWAFRANQSIGSGNFFYDGLFYADDTFSVQLRDGSANEVGNIRTTQVFRDPSAWYHFVVVIDTTQATSSNRMKLYVNGSQVTALGTATYPAQNFDTGANTSGYPFWIGNFPAASPGSTYNFDGYMAEVNFIDGQALTPSSFGETDAQTGVWVPKRYTGTYGTNGFRLPFTNNSTTTALGYDASGNGNNWTPNNFSVTAGTGNDSLLDVPSLYGTDTGLGGEVRGNYCTLNPLRVTTATLTNGNLETSTGNTATKVLATLGMSSGKWYWEFSFTNIAGDGACGIATGNSSSTAHVGNDADSWSYRSVDGYKGNNSAVTAYGATWTTNDIIGVSFDADVGSLSFYKNGVSQGVAFTGLTSGPYFPAFGDNASGASSTLWTNFGQRPFAYTAPTGFKALCTTNLSAPAIGQTSTNQADNYFNTVLYNGTGATQSITGVGFQPDFLWIKGRSVDNHNLHNSIVGAATWLSSDTTGAEQTNSAVLTSFDADGFTVGSNPSSNASGVSFVAWSWNAGGSTVTNTQGSITSSVRANPSSGFSVVTYTGNGSAFPTGATVGHGLGAIPQFIILKRRNDVGNWYCYHVSIGNANRIDLNTTSAIVGDAGAWNSTTPTSALFSIGNSGNTNTNATTYVAYCFAAIPGFSAFGSYTGNGSTDGPFVYTGFRPRWVLIKVATGSPAADWVLHDTSRNPYNVSDTKLSPNTSAADVTTSAVNIDILSSGFKIRNTDGAYNTSSNTYIYAAFAEYPFRLSLAR